MKGIKVGILTTFYAWDTSYSLCTVVDSQLRMLVKNGYQPVLFTLPGFKDDSFVPAGVEIRRVIPQFVLEPYGNYDLTAPIPDTFNRDVSVAKKAFIENFKDIQIMFTHDIIFINSFIIYNRALREAIQEGLEHVRWFHWAHSGPSTRPEYIPFPHDLRYNIPPNSKLIYMNDTDALRMAEMYQGKLDDVRVVENPMDIGTLFPLHPIARKIVDDFDLNHADIVQIYPLSTPRMESNKQISKVIAILSKLKEQGKSVRLVVPNAHANAQPEKDAIEAMLKLAESRGMTRKEVIFTSLLEAPKWELGIPHEAVRDLFLYSNLFIFPSVSENCPLVLLEAASAKNLLVLNSSFPAMHDFFGENALYFEFGSIVKTVKYNDMENYFFEIATIILGELKKNRPLMANVKLRQAFNEDYIFKQRLEPVMYEQW
jgi:glycosyltransferase involved in cell wall biosynthesis